MSCAVLGFEVLDCFPAEECVSLVDGGGFTRKSLAVSG